MLCLEASWPGPLDAQRGGMFLGSPDDPAIAYATAPVSNVVDDLNRRLDNGSARLTFDGRSGYLASALDALALPADSQMLLFSKASLQGRLIGPANPRALFFNDRVALGWVRDGDLLEVAAHDARAGVVFYTLEFSHQTHLTNLLTRASWEARAADPALHPGATAVPGQSAMVDTLMRGVAEEVVDYMLLVDEAPLPSPVRGRSGFAERMSARGPRDRKGRSLFELDLDRRLLEYPCSYLIYSPAFDALPPRAKAPIYERMWHVLAGEAREPRYRSLSLADRQAVVEILEDTKRDLPAYFTAVTK